MPRDGAGGSMCREETDAPDLALALGTRSEWSYERTRERATTSLRRLCIRIPRNSEILISASWYFP